MIQQSTVQYGGAPIVEQTYNLQYRVADLSGTLKALDVRVSWVEPDGRGRTHVVSSVRHDDP